MKKNKDFIVPLMTCAGAIVFAYAVMLILSTICRIEREKPITITPDMVKPTEVEATANACGSSGEIAKVLSTIQIPEEVVKAEEPIVTEFVEVISVEEVTEVTEEEPQIVISEEEFDLLCRCVQAEAGNQSYYGKQLVADVVLNRVDTGWADSITGVITQKNQFATYPTMIKNAVVDESTIEAVTEELQNRTNYEVIAFRTGHFHHNSQWEDWEQVGDHYFSINK